MRGKLIVIEGSDGSGKTTQLELLKKYFKDNKLPFKSMKFPQYANTFFGKTIASFLRGEIGDLKNINPYLISMVYAMDRAAARDKLYSWMNSGKSVLLDRYVTSNMAHQCGRLPKKEHKKYLRWLEQLEYKVNNVPREDVVIYLYVPYLVSQKLLMNENKGDKNYAKGRKKDIVEENKEYLKNAEKTYLMLAKKYKHWVKIDCVDEKGILRSREEIHSEIVQILNKKSYIS